MGDKLPHGLRQQAGRPYICQAQFQIWDKETAHMPCKLSRLSLESQVCHQRWPLYWISGLVPGGRDITGVWRGHLGCGEHK